MGLGENSHLHSRLTFFFSQGCGDRVYAWIPFSGIASVEGRARGRLGYLETSWQSGKGVLVLLLISGHLKLATCPFIFWHGLQKLAESRRVHTLSENGRTDSGGCPRGTPFCRHPGFQVYSVAGCAGERLRRDCWPLSSQSRKQAPCLVGCVGKLHAITAACLRPLNRL